MLYKNGFLSSFSSHSILRPHPSRRLTSALAASSSLVYYTQRSRFGLIAATTGQPLSTVSSIAKRSRVSDDRFVWRRKKGVTDGRTALLWEIHSLVVSRSLFRLPTASAFSLLCRAVQCAFLRMVRPLAFRCAIVIRERGVLLQAGKSGTGDCGTYLTASSGSVSLSL